MYGGCLTSPYPPPPKLKCCLCPLMKIRVLVLFGSQKCPSSFCSSPTFLSIHRYLMRRRRFNKGSMGMRLGSANFFLSQLYHLPPRETLGTMALWAPSSAAEHPEMRSILPRIRAAAKISLAGPTLSTLFIEKEAQYWELASNFFSSHSRSPTCRFTRAG